MAPLVLLLRNAALKGYRIDKKTGKPVKNKSKQSVSQRIAERKKPKQKYQRGTRS